MSFCTAITCIDGRVQLPVIKYLQQRFGVKYVDLVTEAGINHVLALQVDDARISSINDRVDISIRRHKSVGIAVVGHYDCAANPASERQQAEHTRAAVLWVKDRFAGLPVIGLWVDRNWQVREI